MAELRDPRSVVESAEQAAAVGDHGKAEQLLREAALLQEARLGPLHPDLANTLNNLGVLYEITNRQEDAEDCYRRAYAIVKAVLAPDHPFVATSGKNLRDLCEARGRPADAAASLPSPAEPDLPATAGRSSPGEAFVDATRERASDQQRRPTTRSSRLLVIGAVALVAVVIATILATRPWSDEVGAGFSQVEATRPPRESPPPRAEPAPARPVPEPKAATSSRPETVRESPGTAAPARALPSVVEARVCRNLTTGGSRDWQCDPVDGSEPGTFFFYTRLKAATDTTVEHRWYRGDRLHQAMELRVLANPGSGYRTYSRTTVSHLRAGEWRVELRANDGTLLDEARFTVR